MPIALQRKWITLLLAIVMALTAQNAQARRRMFFIPSFGSGSSSSSSSMSETVDLVKALPDTADYFDGTGYVDLGLLHGFKETYRKYDLPIDNNVGVLVLYRGDRYRILDKQELAQMRAQLGYDPVPTELAARLHHMERHDYWQKRLKQAGRSAAALKAIMAEAKAKGESQYLSAAKDPKATDDKSTTLGFGIIGFLVIAIGLFVLVKLIGGSQKLARAFTNNNQDQWNDEPAPLATGSFDERVAQRLREINEPPAATAPAATQRPSFGRRVT